MNRCFIVSVICYVISAFMMAKDSISSLFTSEPDPMVELMIALSVGYPIVLFVPITGTALLLGAFTSLSGWIRGGITSLIAIGIIFIFSFSAEIPVTYEYFVVGVMGFSIGASFNKTNKKAEPAG